MSLALPAVTLPDLSAVITILVLSIVALFFFAPVSISTLFPLLPAQASDALNRTHTKLGVPSEESNLQDQTSGAHLPQPGRPARIQALYVYPVKSCRGIELRRSKVEPKGLEFDRLYTFARQKLGRRVDDGGEKQPEWEIATLRQLPLLANVHVDVWLPDERKLKGSESKSGSGFIVVRFPWKDAGLIRASVQLVASILCRGVNREPQKEIILPMTFPSSEEIEKKGYHYEDIQFFTWRVFALNMGSEVPPELATYLGSKGPLSLFRMDPNKPRQIFMNAPRKEIVGFQPVVDFQDVYPLHLLNLASARALESKIPESEAIPFLDAKRFRPNIIVSGLPAYDEDDWRLIRARSSNGRGQDVRFDVSCRSVRCKLPNVDPATGTRHRSEPDNTLRKYREIDEGAPKKGCFGMHMCPLFAETEDPRQLQGFLEVGMEIDVVQRGPHHVL